MACPKVFISSTCYDLGQVRDNLLSFIKSFYFEPVLSERGDVFYNPDLHTHECCINEVGNCHLFILIIGGRFGGNYVYDTKKSIVNAEYAAARENEIPVFTFIKRDVYEDHRVYNKNRSEKDILDRIQFPSIEKQEYALRIFEFIDEIRHSKVNNGYSSFEFARDIEAMLGKQWSGMFFDFLQKRKANKQFELTTNLLSNLSVASQKTEELIKSMYIHIGKDEAQEKIETIDLEARARKFFKQLLDLLIDEDLSIDDINKAINVSNEINWIDFVQLFNTIDYIRDATITDVKGESYYHDIITSTDGKGFIIVKGFAFDTDKEDYNELSELFNCYLKLNIEQRTKVIQDFVHKSRNMVEMEKEVII